MSKKTDNSSLSSKLKLRRHFLAQYPGSLRVIDCCQGNGFLWNKLRDEFELESYWGLDKKPRPGRLKIDSVRVLAKPGWDANVIDIDTYGSPWKHWKALLPNVTEPVTVFLTIGVVLIGTDRYESYSLGLSEEMLKHTPDSLRLPLHDLAIPYCLQRAHQHGLRLREVKESDSSMNARYFGIRLEPANDSRLM